MRITGADVARGDLVVLAGLVTAIGGHTESGRIGRSLASLDVEATQLQRETRRIVIRLPSLP